MNGRTKSILYIKMKKSIQKYVRPNLEVIETTRESILIYQQDVLFAIYSAGYPIDVFKNEYIKALEAMYNA